MRHLVLVSGGVDSVTLLHWVHNKYMDDEIGMISFNYGQKHSRELKEAKYWAKKYNFTHQIIKMDWLGQLIKNGTTLVNGGSNIPAYNDIQNKEQPSTYVPFRNLVMLSLAASYAEANNYTDIWYAAQSQDFYGYWDCTKEFVDAVNNVTKLNRLHKIEVHAPFVNLSKTDVVKWGLEHGVDYSHTWTCYNGSTLACATCPSCIERINAFANNNAVDPISYANPFDNTKKCNDWIELVKYTKQVTQK